MKNALLIPVLALPFLAACDENIFAVQPVEAPADIPAIVAPVATLDPTPPPPPPPTARTVETV